MWRAELRPIDRWLSIVRFGRLRHLRQRGQEGRRRRSPARPATNDGTKWTNLARLILFSEWSQAMRLPLITHYSLVTLLNPHERRNSRLQNRTQASSRHHHSFALFAQRDLPARAD